VHITIRTTKSKYMENKNEFVFSTLRQFGSENISFKATILSDKTSLTEKEIKDNISGIDLLIREAFIQSEKRANDERVILSANADLRAEGIRKLDKSLQDEIQAKKDAQKTMFEAEKVAKKLGNK
jgi:hypothetical protein